MGMYYNQFTMLYNRKHESAFRRFRLTALLLHDPEDQEFKSCVLQQFDRLSTLTGDKMLFVSFVEPKQEAFERYAFDIERGLRRMAFDRGMDNDATVTLAMHMLGMDLGVHLPCIVLTNSLESRRYLLLPTSAYRFERQMEELAAFCRGQLEPVDLNDDRLQRLVARLGGDGQPHLSQVVIGSGLMGLCAPQYSHDEDYAVSRDAQKVCARRRRYFVEQVRKFGQDLCGEEASVMERQYDGRNYRSIIESGRAASDLRLYEALVGGDDSPDGDMEPDGGVTYASHDSFGYRVRGKSGNMLDMLIARRAPADVPSDAVHGVPSRALLIDIPPKLLPKCHIESRVLIKDYNRRVVKRREMYDRMSEIVQDLGLFAELELNLSVTQMLRNCMGVEMPKFYYRSCGKARGKYRYNYGTDGYVDMDQEVLTLGQILTAYNQMQMDIIKGRALFLIGCFRAMDEGFGDTLYNIKKFRNRCSGAHIMMKYDSSGELVRCCTTYGDLRDMHKYVQALVDNSLQRMIEIKDELNPQE